MMIASLVLVHISVSLHILHNQSYVCSEKNFALKRKHIGETITMINTCAYKCTREAKSTH